MKEVEVEPFPGVKFIGRSDAAGHITMIPPPGTRACGSCTLCCTVMPVAEIKKPDHTRCQHLSAAKRCTIYEKRPRSCEVWWCMWTVQPEMPGALRPDHSHVVIDIEPERIMGGKPGALKPIPVVVVWVDPKFPDAYRAPAFLVALEALCKALGGPALIRQGSEEAFAVYPPGTAPGGHPGWVQINAKTDMNLSPWQDEKFPVLGGR